ncbi:MAG: hypothetical protein JWR40_2890 [Massilia sp.]|nr:hypothetical protein [Massilia sp.]
MMTTTARPRFSVLPRAARAALQWRLLLLWAACLLVPAALMALPMWRLLAGSFGHSVHAAALAREVDLTALADVVANYGRSGAAFPLAAAEALLLTLLLSPLLSGMAMSAMNTLGEIGTLATAKRPMNPLSTVKDAVRPHGFGALLAGGLREYPRMARMLIVALVPLGLAAALGAWAMRAAGSYGETATLQSSSDAARMAALLLLLLLLALAHATLDAGRATLALDPRRRSACLAWWQGCKRVMRRPRAALVTFALYMAITLAGLALAAALAVARIHLPPLGAAGLTGGFLLTQLIVMVLAWMRTARLFAMVELAKPPLPPEI